MSSLVGGPSMVGGLGPPGPPPKSGPALSYKKVNENIAYKPPFGSFNFIKMRRL